MITIKAAKANFFDREKVLKAVDRARRGVLSKIGAFVRTRAKSSIRKRKKVSAPGSPPSSHVGTLKRLIYFSYDDSRNSVVVGPTLINNSSGAPSALEHGGTSLILDRKTGKSSRATIAARPYMGPALEAEAPGFPAMWANSVK